MPSTSTTALFSVGVNQTALFYWSMSTRLRRPFLLGFSSRPFLNSYLSHLLAQTEFPWKSLEKPSFLRILDINFSFFSWLMLFYPYFSLVIYQIKIIIQNSTKMFSKKSNYFGHFWIEVIKRKNTFLAWIRDSLVFKNYAVWSAFDPIVDNQIGESHPRLSRGRMQIK